MEPTDKELHKWKLDTEKWMRKRGLSSLLVPNDVRASVIPWFLLFHTGLAIVAYDSHCTTMVRIIIYITVAVIVAVGLYLIKSGHYKESRIFSFLNPLLRYISLMLLVAPYVIWLWVYHGDKLFFWVDREDTPAEVLTSFFIISILIFGSLTAFYFVFGFTFKLIVNYITAPVAGIAVLFNLTSISFLLFNNGSWQVASDFKIPYGVAIMVFSFVFWYVIIAAIVVLFKSTTSSISKSLGQFSSWGDVNKVLIESSGSELPDNTLNCLNKARNYIEPPGKISKLREWGFWFSIYIHRLWFIVLGIMVGLIAFFIGLMTIGTNTISSWTEGSVNEMHRWDLIDDFGGPLVITWELVAISSFIAIVATIQFMLVVRLSLAKEGRLVDEFKGEIKRGLALREIYYALERCCEEGYCKEGCCKEGCCEDGCCEDGCCDSSIVDSSFYF